MGNNEGVPFLDRVRSLHIRTVSAPGSFSRTTLQHVIPLKLVRGTSAYCLSALSSSSVLFLAPLFADPGICFATLYSFSMAAVTEDGVLQVGQKARASLGPGKSRRCLVLCVGDENVSVVQGAERVSCEVNSRSYCSSTWYRDVFYSISKPTEYPLQSVTRDTVREIESTAPGLDSLEQRTLHQDHDCMWYRYRLYICCSASRTSRCNSQHYYRPV